MHGEMGRDSKEEARGLYILLFIEAYVLTWTSTKLISFLIFHVSCKLIMFQVVNAYKAQTWNTYNSTSLIM
eukprot:g138.t1